MINFEVEVPVPLNSATSLIPSRPSRASILRWVSSGERGKKLETVLIGGRRFTTTEAIERFLAASNPLIAEKKAVAAHKRRVEAAMLTLKARGI